jgi:hypothetical protein
MHSGTEADHAAIHTTLRMPNFDNILEHTIVATATATRYATLKQIV